MLQHNTKIKVLNRDNGTVHYDIPDLRIVRTFQPNETKVITFEEIEKLSYIPGGMRLLKDYLMIQNKEAYEAIFNVNTDDADPEYFYTKEEVRTLLTEGSMDQLIDCLNFAPKSVIDLVKEEAVALPLNDVAKRDVIYEKTGFNITKALEIKKIAAEPIVAEKATPAATKTATPAAPATPVRRAATPIVNNTIK